MKIHFALMVLQNNNITFLDNNEFYRLIMAPKYIDHVYKLKPIFNIFTKNNIPFSSNQNLYIEALKHIDSIDNLDINSFDTFNEFGISFKQYPEYFNYHTLFTHNEMVRYVIKTLKEANYTLQEHKSIFDKVLGMLSKEDVPYQTVVNIVSKVCIYAEKNAVIEAKDLKEIIDSTLTQYDYITFGPLNKSEATIQIEKLLEAMSDQNFSGHLDFIDPDYILRLPNQTEINLSVLVKNANLSQLELSEELIQKLSDKLNSIMTVKRTDVSSQYIDDFTVSLLPEVQQWAMRLYIRTPYYENINKIFRSKPLEKVSLQTGRSRMLCQNNESDNMLANFIVGCLLNDAVNSKIPDLMNKRRSILDKIAAFYKIDIKDYFSDKDKLKELLQESLQKNVITPNEYKLLILNNKNRDVLDRIAKHFNIVDMNSYFDNMSKFNELLQNSLVSSVISKEDYNTLFSNLEKFHYLYPSTTKRLVRAEEINEKEIERRIANPSTLVTFTSLSANKEGSKWFQNPKQTRTIVENPPPPYCYNPGENEVSLPQGTQVITSQQVESFGGKKCVKLFSTVFNSPSLDPGNHYWSDLALTHVFNKYLKAPKDNAENKSVTTAHPKDGMPHIYRKVLGIEPVIQYLAHYAKDPDFKSFCQKISETDMEWLRLAVIFNMSDFKNEMNAINFADFVKKVIPYPPEKMQERMQDIIRNMGNDYEQKNQHSDITEQNTRNYFYRIISIAQKLDLSQDGADLYLQSMTSCQELSQPSTAQNQAMEEMMKYMIDLRKAHGDKIGCDFENGRLQDKKLDYQPTFVEVSQSRLELFNVSDSVPKPKRTLPFQYPREDTDQKNDNAGKELKKGL